MEENETSMASENSSEKKTNQCLPDHYSGKYKGSFAYLTIKDRLPVILVKVIDSLCRNKDSISEHYGENASEEIKDVIGRLSCLQNEMVTNKPIKPINDEFEDVTLWNDFLIKEEKICDFPPAWFDSSWLYAECYFYRRIKQAFLFSSLLKDYDPFHEQKKESFFSTMDAVIFLCSALDKTITELKNCNNESEKFNFFRTYLEASLWGNKWDLSLSAGKKSIELSNPLQELDELRKKILVNETEIVYQTLNNAKMLSQDLVIDFVLDNAGFELFCDLCFIHFLFASGFASKINIYTKIMPWFVSDTLNKDINWLLKTLSGTNHENLIKFSRDTYSRIESGEFNIVEEKFWTVPNDFSEMKSVSNDLYMKLAKSDLVIFKGDLNYRKLTGDRQWEETTSFKQALNGFGPTSIVTLRTIKADVVVGLKEGTSEILSKESKDWKFSGNYALIQCCMNEK